MTKEKLRFFSIIVILAIGTLFILGGLVRAVFIRKPESTTVERTPIVERGLILDRNGDVLAIQTRQKNVTIWKPNIVNIEETAKILADIFSRSVPALMKKIEEGAKYQTLFKNAKENQIQQIETLKSEGKLKGVYLEDALDRLYPLGELASHIIGFTDYKNIGKSGIEQKLDETLYPAGSHFHSGYGNTVKLTIDKNIQYYCEKIAQKGWEENKAESVIFIVMDAKNGEILALTSRPTYNPNELENANRRSLANLSAVYAYEPGSVFKIFSIGAALDTGLINKDSLFDCEGNYIINPEKGKKIKITCLKHHGLQHYNDVIKNSCNVGTSTIMEEMNNYNFYQILRDFGFGQPTGIEFPYENPGILSHPKRWSIRSKPTIAFGQEILTTAIQLVTATTVYTNEGKLLKPHLVQSITRPDGSLVRQYHREPIRQVLQPQTAKDILAAMEENTIDGTGKRSIVKGLKISTKTGTAQMIDKKTKRYSKESYFASCLAVLPTDDPQFIIYGGINSPKGESIYGGVIATPLIKELAIECIYQYNLDRGQSTKIETDNTVRRAIPQQATLGNRMPNLIGFAKSDLMPLFKNKKMKIKIKGNGWVVKQDPPEGTEIDEESVITLELE